MLYLGGDRSILDFGFSIEELVRMGAQKPGFLRQDLLQLADLMKNPVS